jgi:hypothetical protein
MNIGCGWVSAPIVSGNANNGSGAGFGSVLSTNVASIARTGVGSRLVFLGS